MGCYSLENMIDRERERWGGYFSFVVLQIISFLKMVRKVV